MRKSIWLHLATIAFISSSIPFSCFSQTDQPFLHDRGNGMATSQNGVYVEKHDFVVAPFYQYSYSKDKDYVPSEFGFNSDEEFTGKSIDYDGILYVGYGINDWLMIEGRGGIVGARQYRNKADDSGFPEMISEHAVGDVEAQVRWRYGKETEKRPEVYSYLDFVFPFDKEKTIIGTQNLEVKFGTGVIKGFSWGTISARASLQYIEGENVVETGIYAIEYLKRINNRLRIYVGIEGEQDDIGIAGDLQVFLAPWIFTRISNSFGLTPKATDYAVSFGVVGYLNELYQ
ncbi:MAG: hypothetical protein ACR2MX_08715 [Cyclobacteriaceae bacterium]